MFCIGKQLAKVSRTFLATSSKGNDQIGIVFADLDGSTITKYLSCTEKAYPYTERDLITLGWVPAENNYEFEGLNGDNSPLEGVEVSITIQEEVYEGRSRMKVAFINSARPQVMEETEAVSCGDRIRMNLGITTSPAPASVKPKPRAQAKAKVEQDEDLSADDFDI